MLTSHINRHHPAGEPKPTQGALAKCQGRATDHGRSNGLRRCYTRARSQGQKTGSRQGESPRIDHTPARVK